MTLLEEVKAFARDYVNGNQTRERTEKVKAAYRQITGTNLHTNCGTCLTEAIFKILRHMERPPCRYRLKKGAILQPFGGGIITNDNLTDAIAEECLRTIRGAASLFAEMPAPPPPEPELKIIPPASGTGQPPADAVNDDLGTGQPPVTDGTNNVSHVADDLGTAKPAEQVKPKTAKKSTAKSKPKAKAAKK